MFYKIHTKQAPSNILLPSFLLSLQDQDTPLENFLTVSQLYQEPQLSTVSYLEQLLCGMPYLLMFNKQAQSVLLRGAWRDRDTNDIFAHCSLIFYFLDFKFSNFVCLSELYRLIWFFFKNSFRKKKNIRKTTQNALAPSIFIVLSIVLKLGTPLLHTQAQKTLLQNF